MVSQEDLEHQKKSLFIEVNAQKNVVQMHYSVSKDITIIHPKSLDNKHNVQRSLR